MNYILFKWIKWCSRKLYLNKIFSCLCAKALIVIFHHFMTIWQTNWSDGMLTSCQLICGSSLNPAARADMLWWRGWETSGLKLVSAVSKRVTVLTKEQPLRKSEFVHTHICHYQIWRLPRVQCTSNGDKLFLNFLPDGQWRFTIDEYYWQLLRCSSSA